MSAPATTADADSDAKGAGGSGLTFPQIAAGALAAATASILGSFLGVLGTIGGAAAASIVSTVGAALYQRSLERTRDKVKERLVVNPTGSQVASAVARVTGQGRAGAATSGPVRPGGAGTRPGVPASAAAPTRALPGGPGARPGGPFGPPPGMPPRPVDRGGQHADRGRPLPREQQLRAGGRTVATQVHTQVNAQGAPTRVGPPPYLGPGGIPNARTTGTPPGGIQPTTRMPPAGSPGWGGDDAATQLTHVTQEGEQPARRFGKRTWITLAGVGVSVFVIGILASFGVESATGHPLSGGSSGTSVGSLFGQQTGTATATTEPSTTETNTDGSSETTTSSADRSGSSESTGSNRDQDGSSQQTSQRRSSSSDSGNGDSGGGLLPTQLLPRFSNNGSTNG